MTYPSAPSIQLRKFFNAGCQGSVELILWERQTSELLEVAKVPSLASEVAADEPSKECCGVFRKHLWEGHFLFSSVSGKRSFLMFTHWKGRPRKFRDSKEVDWTAACTEPQKINTIKHVAQNSGINVENLPQNKITLYNIIQVILASQGRKFQKTTKKIYKKKKTRWAKLFFWVFVCVAICGEARHGCFPLCMLVRMRCIRRLR